jgi:RNA polymerase sigma factor (sigma-70 family)
MADVTHLLDAAAAGYPHAAAELLPLVYDELRKLAAARMAAEAPGQTLQPTALVHEAYLRLMASRERERPELAHPPVTDVPGSPGFANRAHFFAAAAEAMRRILVDAARRKGRDKHGGGRHRIDLDAAAPAVPDPRHDVVALDAALTRLAEEDPLAARIVEMRHFAGLTVAEAAETLGVSPRTADRLWAFARAWLHRELAGTDADPGA